MKNYNIEPMAYNDNSASRPSFYTSTHVVGMKHPGLNLVVWNESNVFYTTNRLCPKQLWKYNFIKKKCNFHSSTKLHFSQEAKPPVFLSWNCTFWNRFGLKKISTVLWNCYFLDVSCLKYTHIQKVSSYQPDRRGVWISVLSVYRGGLVVDGTLISTWGGTPVKHVLKM